MATEGKQKRVSLLRRMLTARGRSLEITTAGWLFILLTLAVGFAAINSGANLLHVIFGVQLGLIVASGVLSENMVRRARARRIPSSALHAQSPGALRVELSAREGRGELLALSVEDDDRIEGLEGGADDYLSKRGCHVNSPNLQVGKLFVDQAACAADFHASNASSRW